MVRIKFRTKEISPILITLLVVGVLMLVTGGVMLSCYSSSEVTAAPEPTAKEVLSSPSALQVTELVINPTEVNPGEEVIITAKVTNTGDTEESRPIELRVNSIVEVVKQITVPAGGTTTFSFYESKGVPGTYRVTVGELTEQFVVVEPIELTQARGFETTEGGSTTQCGCGCGRNFAVTEPEPEVPSCCGG